MILFIRTSLRLLADRGSCLGSIASSLLRLALRQSAGILQMEDILKRLEYQGAALNVE